MNELWATHSCLSIQRGTWQSWKVLSEVLGFTPPERKSEREDLLRAEKSMEVLWEIQENI